MTYRKKHARNAPSMKRSKASRRRYKTGDVFTNGLKALGIHIRPKNMFKGLCVIAICGFFAWVSLSGQFDIWQTQTKEVFHKTAQHNGFAIHYIDVDGRNITDHKQLSSLITPLGGHSIFAASLPEIRDQLKNKLAWVDDVSVQRILPNRLAVTLHELTPRARYYHGSKRYILNETINGETSLVMYEDMYNHFAHLPLITGAHAPKDAHAILSALDTRPFLNIHVKAMDYISQRRWNIELENGLEVLLPQKEIAMHNALDRLSMFIEEDNLLNKNIVRLDMRLKDRHIVRAGPSVPTAKPNSKQSKTALKSKKSRIN